MNSTTDIADTETLKAYREAGGNLDSAENQRILARLIKRDVYHCCSTMVSEITRLGQDVGGWTQEEMMDLHERRVDHSERLEEIEERVSAIEDETEDSDDAGESLLLEEQQLQREQTELEDEQENPAEVYEHWAVSKYFAGQLEAAGETVGELFDFTLWGRTTTGQAIHLDYVIQQIGAEMGILKGQKHDWSKQ